jgi:hypothetical protein
LKIASAQNLQQLSQHQYEEILHNQISYSSKNKMNMVLMKINELFNFNLKKIKLRNRASETVFDFTKAGLINLLQIIFIKDKRFSTVLV